MIIFIQIRQETEKIFYITLNHQFLGNYQFTISEYGQARLYLQKDTYCMEGKKACSYSYACFVSEHFCPGVVCNHTAHQDQPLARPCLEDQRWSNGHLDTGNHPSAVLLPQTMGSCVIVRKVSKSLRNEHLLFMGLFHCFFPL